MALHVALHGSGCLNTPSNYVRAVRAALSAAFAVAHPAANADRPWELLNAGDPVRVGDEVRQELDGVTTIAIVGRVDEEGDPWTTENRFIGVIEYGTWYVRRTAQELPTWDGAVIVPADGHEYIAMADAEGWVFDRMTYSAEHDRWYGMTARGAIAMCSAEQIAPGTWKVAGE